MSAELIDSHCHLDLDPFSPDRVRVLSRAEHAGVTHCVVPAVRASAWLPLLQWQQREPRIGIALGLHPGFIAEHSSTHIGELEKLLALHRQQILAVGEIGLDRALPEPEFERQLALFEQQLALAQQFQLPVILHVRKAHPETLHLLKTYALPRGGVIHAFSGSFQLAESYLKLGFKLGIGGVITYARANKTRQAVARLPADSLLLETDSPDMPLQGFQGQRNAPERLPLVLDALAELRREPRQQLAEQLVENTRQLFGWPESA